MFEKVLVAGWRDMDYNSHMANTACLDRAADKQSMKIGPVVMKDEMEYFREVHLLQEIRVRLSIAGLAPDGSRFILRNDFSHADGARCAAMAALTKVDGFRELRSSVAN